jgi:hypothetical protein
MPSQVVTLAIEIVNAGAISPDVIPSVLAALEPYGAIMQEFRSEATALMQAAQRAGFDSQGALYGTPWFPNSTRYAAWKMEWFGSGAVGVLTGRLANAAGATVYDSDTGVTVGIDSGQVPYASAFERNSSGGYMVEATGGEAVFYGKGHPGRILVAITEDEFTGLRDALYEILVANGLPSSSFVIMPSISDA